MRVRLLIVGTVASSLVGTACSSADTGDVAGTGGIFEGGAAGVTANGGSAGAMVQTTGGAMANGTGGALGSGGASGGSGGLVGAGGTAATGGAGAASGGTITGSGGSATGGMGGASAGGLGGAAANGGASGAAGGGGASGAGGAGSSADPCEGGVVGLASDASGSRTRVSGYGNTQFTVSTKTQITSLETTLIVPAKPKSNGTLFLWPGLEPLQGGESYSPIGTGVLQPVLTWGSSCAPNGVHDYSSWWISAQYVNTLATSAGHTGCLGGSAMTVAVGDELHILMSSSGTKWNQQITDNVSGKNVSYEIDMDGQAQNWALFEIEVPTSTEPSADVVFTSTVITIGAEDTNFCAPSARGTNDYFSAPKRSMDGLKCCVGKIILRGQGVPASGPNQ